MRASSQTILAPSVSGGLPLITGSPLCRRYSATSSRRRGRPWWPRDACRIPQLPRSTCARAVHLQLRGLGHERDDQRHHGGLDTTVQGVQATITLFLLIMAIL